MRGRRERENWKKDRSRRGQPGRGVENVPKKRMSVSFWDAGRRIRWWVLSLTLWPRRIRQLAARFEIQKLLLKKPDGLVPDADPATGAWAQTKRVLVWITGEARAKRTAIPWLVLRKRLWKHAVLILRGQAPEEYIELMEAAMNRERMYIGGMTFGCSRDRFDP